MSKERQSVIMVLFYVVKERCERIVGITIKLYKIFLLTEVWKNRNETENFSQIHEVELVKEEMRKIVEAEVRLQVLLYPCHC